MKSGFIAVTGKANAGKSTLVNSLVGEKVSIVSHKPQTTRDRIFGILNGEGYQAVFIDTPGLHRAKNALSQYMMKEAEGAPEGADAVLYLLACDKQPDKYDEERIKAFAAAKTPSRTIGSSTALNAAACANPSSNLVLKPAERISFGFMPRTSRDSMPRLWATNSTVTPPTGFICTPRLCALRTPPPAL